VDLIGHIASGQHRGIFDRRGRELNGSKHGPGSFYPANDITNERKKNLATPPQPHVRKKLEPDVPQGTSRQPSST
jgi:hypothetical protein